jgi:hypothetical protein
MLKLLMLAGLMLLFVILAAATRLMPHGTAAETATPPRPSSDNKRQLVPI